MFVEVVDFGLHRATASGQMSLSLLLGVVVCLLELIVDLLGLLGAEQALRSEDVLSYAVEVSLATSNLR